MNPHKKTILITRFPYESNWGGEESHTMTLAKHLRNKGFEVLFFGSCPILLKTFRKEGFLVKKVWAGKMIVTLWELLKSFLIFPFICFSLRRAFKKIAKVHDIRALYCLSLNEKLFLTPLAAELGIPVTWVEHQEIRAWLTSSPWKWIYKKNSQNVKIIPISKANEALLKNSLHINSSHIVMIINGVNTLAISRFKEIKQSGLILAANRFISKKGIMDFVKASQILFEKGLEIEVRIVGQGDEAERIKEYVRNNLKNEKIYVQNYLKKEKWYSLLSKTDVYVSCSRDSNETFSLNTAEALAAGCKVVVTHCSGIADFLKNGHNAMITRPKDSHALALSIEKAIAMSERMRTEARRIASDLFDQRRMLRSYESLILRN